MHIISFKKLTNNIIKKTGYKIEKISNAELKKDPEFKKIQDIPGFLSQNAFHLFSVLSEITDHNTKLTNQKVLEIGVYCGRSLLALGLLYRRNKVVGVDPFYNSFYNSPAYPEEAKYMADKSLNTNANTRIDILKSKINDLSLENTVELRIETQERFIKDAKLGKYKLAYVDGEHSYKSINFFLNNMDKLLVKDSLLVIDDILSAGYPGISEALHRHKSFKKTIIPICYAFNKGVFIYKPTIKNINYAINKIKNFAKKEKKACRKSDIDSSVIIFE